MSEGCVILLENVVVYLFVVGDIICVEMLKVYGVDMILLNVFDVN